MAAGIFGKRAPRSPMPAEQVSGPGDCPHRRAPVADGDVNEAGPTAVSRGRGAYRLRAPAIRTAARPPLLHPDLLAADADELATPPTSRPRS